MAGWLLAILGALSAALTWHAFRPLHGPRALPLVVGFAASVATAELALHLLVLEVVGAAALVALGALETWPGRVGAAGVVVSLVGLTVLQVQARRAGDVLDEALADGLGEDYDERVDDRGPGRPGERFGLRQRVLLLPIRDRRVERIRDVVYHRAMARRLRLDVYRHRDRPEGAPCLLQIHGGAWVLGRKEEQAVPLMTRLAAHGWVCFSIDYRLSPHATFPDQLTDVKAALAWIRRHGPEYGADPAKLFITGGSAGGHLCALAALTDDDPDTGGPAQPPLRGAIPFYGVYDMANQAGQWPPGTLVPFLERHVFKRLLAEEPEAFLAASPITHARADAPPFFLLAGTRDTLVPLEEGRRMALRLAAVSRAPVVYAELPGAQHAFDLLPTTRCVHAVRAVERFCTWVLAQDPARVPGPGQEAPGRR